MRGGPVKAIAAGVVGVLLAILMVLFAGSWERIETTEWCVMTRYGNVIEQRMEEGLAFLPIADAECFPLVDINFPADSRDVETISSQTRDPITFQGDVAIVWAYDPGDVYGEAFITKRSHPAVESEVINATRDGYRSAVNGWGVDEIFSARRTELSDSVKVHIQRKLGDLAVIKKVFIRDIKLPDAIESARIGAARQEQVLDSARKQFQIDSVKAAARIVEASGQVELQRVQSLLYEKNPRLLSLEIEKAKAEALGRICANATTCIIGGSVMDTWKGGVIP